MITRRGLIGGTLAAPAIIRTPGLLMPVRPVRHLVECSFMGTSRTRDVWYRVDDVIYLSPVFHDRRWHAWAVREISVNPDAPGDLAFTTTEET